MARYEPKTTVRVTRNKARVVTTTDGVQKSVHIFLKGNNTEDADGCITTGRWTSLVQLFVDGRVVDKDSALQHYATKDQIIRRFTNNIVKGAYA